MTQKKSIMLVIVAVCLVLGGCAASPARDLPAATQVPQATSASRDEDTNNEQPDAVQGDGGYVSAGSTAVDRMVVYRAYYSIETDSVASAAQRLNEQIQATGSYVESSQHSGATQYQGNIAHYTIRVPIAQYSGLKGFAETLGIIKSSNETGEDVTAQYYDREAQLTMLREQQTRIMELIQSAKTLDELFKIEKELTRIRTEIEQLTTINKNLESLVSYATIQIHLYDQELLAISEDSPSPLSFGTRMGDALDGSINWLSTFAQTLVLTLIWIWPLLLIAGVIITIVLVRKKHKARKPK